MLRITRYTLAAASITLALVGCRDAVRPDAIRPMISRAADDPVPLVQHIVAPQTTDPAIDRALADHYAWLDTAARSNHKLLVFMPSANAVPGQFQLVEQEAARLGYHVIGLMYPNSVNLVMACGGAFDPNACFEATRLEILDGVDRSPVVDVNETNSIQNRLVKLLQYLATQYPEESWSRFLLQDQPKWSQIAVGGHSQGGGEAALIAKLQVVARVVLFSAVPDRIGAQSVPWVATHVTPADRYWGLVNDHDAGFLPMRASWDSLGMAAFGPAVAPETTEPPYGFTHMLVTDLTPQGGLVGTKAHISTVRDDAPLLNADGTCCAPRELWWRYLLTAREPDEDEAGTEEADRL